MKYYLIDEFTSHIRNLIMKAILQKCTKEDFEYLSEVLDSYVSFTNDSKRKELLAKFENPTSRRELINLVDKQIRYYGSSDVAYILRELFQGDGGVSAFEVVEDVAKKLKVKIKQGASLERSLEILINAVVEKELHNKKPEELKQYFRKIGVGEVKIQEIIEFMKKDGKVAILPLLVQLLGPEVTFTIIQGIIITIIAQFIGQQAAKKLIEEIVKRNPWLNALGPVIWVLSGSWLAFDLQGEAYRKTVPICLYLGIVALRDGEEADDSLYDLCNVSRLTCSQIR